MSIYVIAFMFCLNKYLLKYVFETQEKSTIVKEADYMKQIYFLKSEGDEITFETNDVRYLAVAF